MISTTSASERVFSIGDHIVNSRRANLKRLSMKRHNLFQYYSEKKRWMLATRFQLNFFVPFGLPCMYHNYGIISGRQACRDCLWPSFLDAELYTTCPRERVLVVLRPVAQLYGQVRTDWSQCFVIDCSLSHPAGHKPFTCSHSVLRNTLLNIHAVRWMRFSARFSVHVFTTSQNLTWSLLVNRAVREL